MKSDNVLSREKEKCPNTIKIYYNKIIIFGGNKMTDVITKQRAASLLNITEKQINRLIKVAETEGATGFIHKNTGISPSNKIPDSIKHQIVSWYKDTYYDFSFSHFCEILHDEKNIKISRTSVAKILFDADILSPKATKKTKALMKRRIKQKNTPSIHSTQRDKLYFYRNYP